MSKLGNFFKKNSSIFTVQFYVVAGLLVVCIVLLAVCGDRGEAEVIQDPPEFPIEDLFDDPDPDEDEWLFVEEFVTDENIFEFVTVGEYKGITYEKQEVDERDVEEFLMMQPEILLLREAEDRPVQDGDFVIIDYLGSLDGVPFQGGADQDAGLLIGSNTFIAGFEDAIIGHSVGDEFDIDVTFPEAYHAPDLAGQDAVFEIKLNKILIEATPGQSEGVAVEWIWDQMVGLMSYDEYTTLIRDHFESLGRDSERRQVFGKVIENAVFHKIPINEVEQREAMAMMQFYYEATTAYNLDMDMDMAELVSQITGMPIEDFVETEIRPFAVNDVKMDLVIRAIATQEGIIVTGDELHAEIENFAREYGYDSVEHFMSFSSETTVLVAMLAERIIEILMEHAVPI